MSNARNKKKLKKKTSNRRYNHDLLLLLLITTYCRMKLVSTMTIKYFLSVSQRIALHIFQNWETTIISRLISLFYFFTLCTTLQITAFRIINLIAPLINKQFFIRLWFTNHVFSPFSQYDCLHTYMQISRKKDSVLYYTCTNTCIT